MCYFLATSALLPVLLRRSLAPSPSPAPPLSPPALRSSAPSRSTPPAPRLSSLLPVHSPADAASAATPLRQARKTGSWGRRQRRRKRPAASLGEKPPPAGKTTERGHPLAVRSARSGAPRAPCDAGCYASTAETALETPARARSRRISQGHELHLDQLYTVRDGGTIALDWLLASDCEEQLMVLGMELFIMMIQHALLSWYLD